ncbi:MAG: hypothetical protein MHM6MM_006723 [Cercozoa sp. M6MM]
MWKLWSWFVNLPAGSPKIKARRARSLTIGERTMPSQFNPAVHYGEESFVICKTFGIERLRSLARSLGLPSHQDVQSCMSKFDEACELFRRQQHQEKRVEQSENAHNDSGEAGNSNGTSDSLSL